VSTRDDLLNIEHLCVVRGKSREYGGCDSGTILTAERDEEGLGGTVHRTTVPGSE
jgi:hypothetical protein